jgi:hypothetical protein
VIATTTEWKQRKRQRELLRYLRDLLVGNVMRGSVVETTRRCGKMNCRCARDEKKEHPQLLLSVSMGGQTRTAHIDRAHVDEVKCATSNYRRLTELLDQLTEVNIKLLRFPARERRK